jgi:hypothetical protein
VAGTDAAPVVGTNAIKVEAPVSNPNFNLTDIREATAGLDRGARIASGGDRAFTGKVYLRGSGTAGTVPEIDPLLKGCALGVTTLAADVTATAAGAATGSITLGAGASATDNAYRGMVVEITAGTGIGQKRLIVSYVGSTKIATISPNWTVVPTGGTYAVRACNVYSPISVAVPNITIYDYAHNSPGTSSKLKKTTGACGNARFSMAPKTVPSFDFDFRGQLLADTDPSNPGAATYQPDNKIAYMDAQVYLGNTKAQLNQLTLDLGNTPVAEDDPNAEYGSGVAGITERRVSGTMRLPIAPENIRSALASFKTGTKFTLTSLHGAVAGNRFGVLLTDVVYTGSSLEDVQGFAYEGLPFDVNATDSGLYICYY